MLVSFALYIFSLNERNIVVVDFAVVADVFSLFLSLSLLLSVFSPRFLSLACLGAYIITSSCDHATNRMLCEVQFSLSFSRTLTNERTNFRQWRLFFLSIVWMNAQIIKISLRTFWNSPRELGENDWSNKQARCCSFFSAKSERHFTCSTEE